MKLSIIPAFNLEKHYEKYPLRVRAEADFDYEVIVCDDGSLDNTAPIISRLAGSLITLFPFSQ